ncbi:hypothetical protein L6R52_30490, partial [Myxococcota bacterium]|nr:hypothetical protein [Myxococcota bacterium]
FEDARRGLVAAGEHGLAIARLAEDVRAGRSFARDAETFRMLRAGGAVVLLVRWVGAVPLDPSADEPTDVWELVDHEGPLGRAIVDALGDGGRD